ncbi:MAG TPA: cation transporter [Thermodesulfobacteriota bacterium]|nr:cation transporter [Thermodesulfobacteriota bacterium]
MKDPALYDLSDPRAVRSLHKKALYLSVFTVAYNFLEGIVSIAAGAAAGSMALVGFGLDSFVESLSGGVMIWRFGGRGALSEEEEERREARAVRLVGYTFFVLGAYVAYECLKKLILREPPEPSLVGIVIAVISLVVMPALFYVKYRLGKSVGSRGLVADSRQTLACCYLSLSLLAGLGLNYLYGIWWADPAAGLVIVAFLFREGLEAVRGEYEGCC